ncbi:hypothetical protein BDL97_04G043400 [Sphagnum fallax]|nr:hypothetical protein BDL97_04G043400 [Sphagnum fallax]
MLSFGSLRGAAGSSAPVGSVVPDGVEGKQVVATVLLECGYYDVEQLEWLTQRLLVILGTACVEKTAGDLFSQPAAVVPDVKKEMLEYLNSQSEAYASGSGVVSSQGVNKVLAPSKVLDDIFEGFVRSKKTLYSRMSSKIMYNEKREEKIEDFVQELDRTGVWMVGRREVVAKALLKRIDRSNTYHCEMRFDTSEELAEHKASCMLRPLICVNDGCSDVFSALHADAHDASCLFKLLPCKLNCEAMVARGEMEKHTLTICPRKMVICSFQPVGCLRTMEQGVLEQHCVEFMGQHLLQVLQSVHKNDIIVGDQTQRISLLEKALSIAQRAEAVDIGSVVLTLKEQENRVKLLEQEVKKLRQDLKATDVSAEVLQLRRELRNFQKQVGSSTQSNGLASPLQ